MFQDKSQPRTELNDMGEFGLIKHLTKNIKIHHPGTLKGIGDDAAVISPTQGMKTLVSKDLLLEGVHFDLAYCPLRHLGYKAMAVNISDMAAMNAKPKQVFVGLGISNRFSLEALDELYEGMKLACERYQVDFCGGDTSSSVSGLILSITIIGEAAEEKITYRSGAKVNDLICVSGDLGAAYAGLLVLQREKATFAANPNFQPDLTSYDYVIERQLKPEARTDINQLLSTHGILPSSMIDVSDGLASELHHLCEQSACGCSVYEDKIPMDVQTMNVADEFNLAPLTFSLHGGEDYELLFTVPIEAFEKVSKLNEISIIGHITDKSEGMHLINKQSEAIELKAQGWDSFK